MGDPRGKRKSAFRIWLDDSLKAHKFDAVAEFAKLYFASDTQERIRLLEMMAQYLFPKARPEGLDGESEQTSIVPVVITPELRREILESVKEAKGDK